MHQGILNPIQQDMGTLLTEVHFNGEEQIRYEYSELDDERTHSTARYVNGELNGVARTFTREWNLATEVNFQGTKHGISRKWNPITGKLISHIEYYHGSMIYSSNWFESGQLQYVITLLSSPDQPRLEYRQSFHENGSRLDEVMT